MKFKNTLFILTASLLNVSVIVSIHTVAITRPLHKKIKKNSPLKQNCAVKYTGNTYHDIKSTKIKTIPITYLESAVDWHPSLNCPTRPECSSDFCGKNFYSNDKNYIDKKTAKKNRSLFLKLINKDHIDKEDFFNHLKNDLSMLNRVEKEIQRRIGRSSYKKSFLLKKLASKVTYKKECIENKLKVFCNAEKKFVQE